MTWLCKKWVGNIHRQSAKSYQQLDKSGSYRHKCRHTGTHLNMHMHAHMRPNTPIQWSVTAQPGLLIDQQPMCACCQCDIGDCAGSMCTASLLPALTEKDANLFIHCSATVAEYIEDKLPGPMQVASVSTMSCYACYAWIWQETTIYACQAEATLAHVIWESHATGSAHICTWCEGIRGAQEPCYMH